MLLIGRSTMLFGRDMSPDYNHFFNNAPIGLWRTRATDGQFLMANIVCAKLLGFDSVDELLKCKTTDLYSNKDRERLVEDLKNKGSICGHELQLVRQDGTVVWLSMSARYDNETIEGSIEDITSRKTSEIKLDACRLFEVKKLDELQKGIRSKIKDISVSITSDRRNS